MESKILKRSLKDLRTKLLISGANLVGLERSLIMAEVGFRFAWSCRVCSLCFAFDTIVLSRFPKKRSRVASCYPWSSITSLAGAPAVLCWRCRMMFLTSRLTRVIKFLKLPTSLLALFPFRIVALVSFFGLFFVLRVNILIPKIFNLDMLRLLVRSYFLFFFIQHLTFDVRPLRPTI